MNTQSQASHMARMPGDAPWLTRHRQTIVRIAMVGLIAGLVLLATAVVAPGLVGFVALMGGCLLMHVFGHGAHGQGGH